MKKISFLIAFFAMMASTQLIGQTTEPNSPMTLFDGENVELGGYGSFSTRYIPIDNLNSLLVGGRGGLLANHRFSIGISGYYMVSDMFSNTKLDLSSFFSGGYGGLYGEIIIFPMKLVNVAIPLEIGAGYLAQIDKYISSTGAAFAYFQPGLEVDLNVTKGFKFGIGVNYSFSEKLNSTNTFAVKPLEGASIGLNIKWGIF